MLQGRGAARDQGLDWLLRLNGVVNQVRRRFGFGYWSLAAFMKHKVKTAVQYMSSFESAVAYEAARQRVDGLICGHIHRAEITHLNGVCIAIAGIGWRASRRSSSFMTGPRADPLVRRLSLAEAGAGRGLIPRV